MFDDDGRHLDPAPEPGGGRTGLRVGCLIVLLAVLCVGGLFLAGELVGKGNVQSSILGRTALSAGAVAGLLATGWATIWMSRKNWRLWRFWTRGEVVRATIEELAVETDYEGDPVIRARVSGRTRTGWSFSRWLLISYYRDPGPEGTPIDVRYHAGLREIGRAPRGLGGLLTSAIMWLLTIGMLAFLLWMLAFLSYGLVRLWT